MTIVLHHYETSPFSEVLRLALGHKNADYWSVIIPNIAPKPLLTPLTGGYRKTPVLQIDADIYCDTSIAAEAIEALPGPTLYPRTARPRRRLHRRDGGRADVLRRGWSRDGADRRQDPRCLLGRPRGAVRAIARPRQGARSA